MNKTVLSIDTLERAIAAFPADEWTEAREAALKQFRKRGFPDQRVEDWKYTDLSNVIDISQRWLSSSPAAAAEAVNVEQVKRVQESLDAGWLVVANGRLVEQLSTGLEETGVRIGKLDSASASGTGDEPLTIFNTMLLAEGLKIRISSDKSAHRPIGLLFVDSAAAGPVVSQARVDIELEMNSAARLLEYHVSAGDQEHYSNTLINLTIQAGARADYLRLQNRAAHHSQTQRLAVQLARRSQLQHCGFDLGGRLTRNDLKIDIVGSQASASFDGLYIAGEGQHIDNHTRIDHRVGPATSTQEYRGILGGRCRCVWNGKAIVHKGADGTDAEQTNHNLLLSENAEIDAKPELEIYADEVKCAHGTTVGQLDAAALFYLRTRGLDEQRAKRVLTRAFAASLVGNSPIVEMHETISQMVERRLTELANGGVA